MSGSIFSSAPTNHSSELLFTLGGLLNLGLLDCSNVTLNLLSAIL